MKEISDQLRKALDAVKADGTNIYCLLNRLKKQINLKRKRANKEELGNFSFPEEALLRVCESYWKYKPKSAWPWFLKVIDAESQKQLREEEDRINAKYSDPVAKRSKVIPMSMKEVLKQMAG